MIWTHHNNKIFNIVHIHSNDRSEEAAVEAQTLSSADFKKRDIKFDRDFAGRPLRYKFLVYNWEIRAVLYNNGASIDELPFKEIKISKDDFYSTD